MAVSGDEVVAAFNAKARELADALEKVTDAYCLANPHRIYRFRFNKYSETECRVSVLSYLNKADYLVEMVSMDVMTNELIKKAATLMADDYQQAEGWTESMAECDKEDIELYLRLEVR